VAQYGKVKPCQLSDVLDWTQDKGSGRVQGVHSREAQMRTARFVLMLALGYVTAFGYANMHAGMIAMGHEWMGGEFFRLILIDLTALCFVLAVVGLWLARTHLVRERQFTIFATVCAYFAFVFVVVAMHSKPEMYSSGVWWLLVGFFSIPFLTSAFLLSDDKYNRSENVPA
jgi:hypothetical protein